MPAYWKCFYHIIWATFKRNPMIQAVHEPVLYGTVKAKVAELKCELFAAEGVEDHIHMVVGIPPALAVSDFVRHVKGVTAHEMNYDFAFEENFRWQTGYGVLTFGESHLTFACDYVNRQKAHHAERKLYRELERVEA
jgi:putative transposase